MANILEYTLSLQDMMSAKLKAIGVNSAQALDKFAALSNQSKKTSELMNSMGRSVGSLREKLSLLKNERDWIPEENIRDIRRYNTEINNLERQIRRLETINGSKLKKWTKEAFDAIPGAGLIKNPLVQAGAAMIYAGKGAMDFDEGMAKVNTTAQLSKEGLSGLKDKLMNMGKDAGADLGKVPEGFEKIISQVGDVDTSLSIMKASLSGAKAGFTDVDVVSGALAQTLSIVGAQNAKAGDVLDTLFAAKRVGAGEFKDFATYMPQLIADAKSLGINYKQTAGLFAFMTAKGMSAERSATLMTNAFSLLGKGDVQKALAKNGVNIFDKKGATRDIQDIVGDLRKRMAGFSDKKKSNFLENMGIKDKEAKSAIMVMVSDQKKLEEAMAAQKNATGETAKALEMSANPMQKVAALWSKVQFLAISLGGALMAIVVPAMDLLNVALDGVLWLMNSVAKAFNWVHTELQSGNVWVWMAVTAIGALATALAISWLWAKRDYIMTKLNAGIRAVVAVATGGWTAAQWLLNESMLANPLTWILVLIIGLIALIAYVVYAYDGWGEAWKHLVNYLKISWEVFKTNFLIGWLVVRNGFLDGIGAMKAAWYNFQSLWDEEGAKAGLATLDTENSTRMKELAEARGKVKELEAQQEAERKGIKVTRNNNTLGGLMDKSKAALGISPATVPGTDPEAAGGGGSDGSDTNKKKHKKTNEAIATGGTKNTTVNITLGNLVHTFNVNAAALREGAQQVREVVVDELTRAIQMGATLGG